MTTLTMTPSLTDDAETRLIQRYQRWIVKSVDLQRSLSPIHRFEKPNIFSTAKHRDLHEYSSSGDDYWQVWDVNGLREMH